MKRTFFKFIGITAMVAAIGFSITALSLTGCSQPTDSSSSPGPGPGGGGNTFQVAGKFTKSGGAGSGEVKFKIADAAKYSRSARAADSNIIDVKGELQDEDFTIRLSGTYDKDTRRYSVSAAASVIRYSIDGGLDESGNSAGSTAKVLVKSGEDWTPYTFVIDETAPTAVTITGTAQNSVEGGVPSAGRGYWYFIDDSRQDSNTEYRPGDEYKTLEATLLVSQWSISYDYFIIAYNGDGTVLEKTPESQQRYSIVEVKSLGSNKYDVIYAYNDIQMGATLDQKKAGIAEYLRSKGYGNAVAYTYAELEGNNYVTPSGPGYIFDENGFGGWFNMPGTIFEDFYTTDYLDLYLLKIGVTPATLYTKNQFEFKSNNTVLEIGYYGNQMSGMPYVSSIAELTGFELMPGTMTMKRR